MDIVKCNLVLLMKLKRDMILRKTKICFLLYFFLTQTVVFKNALSERYNNISNSHQQFMGNKLSNRHYLSVYNQ